MISFRLQHTDIGCITLKYFIIIVYVDTVTHVPIWTFSYIFYKCFKACTHKKKTYKFVLFFDDILLYLHT